ncbi:24912_t:CDS:1, partial [Racocetra persica]
VSEIATIITDDDTIDSGRDIILTIQQGSLQHISKLYGTYNLLQYPLLFPRE